MRNEFRNKLCAYCGKAEATTDDHVIARTFFLENRRANLPKVPACEKCNGEKAKLELTSQRSCRLEGDTLMSRSTFRLRSQSAWKITPNFGEAWLKDSLARRFR
jgi:hypothetical protein